MRRRRRPAHELRIAIDCLPLDSRRAMLDGMDSNRIIVGAYVDRDGGVCPMLAAHRNGGRTSLASFAHAWDRYTRAGNGARPATERELRTLRTMLEASIALDSGGDAEFAAAIADYQSSRRRPQPRIEPPERSPRRDTGERDRTSELRQRHGWAWLRPFRSLDHYEEAMRELREIERERRRRERRRERELV
jgi:hypothetical protein